MKIKLELFGSSRDFSEKDHLELEVSNKASIQDLRNEIIQYLSKKFKGNKNFVNIVKSSAFCSENHEIISGLSQGDKVVAEGLTKIRPNMKVKPIIKSE